MSITVRASQRPERAVATPRSFSSLAIAFADEIPSRSSAATSGVGY